MAGDDETQTGRASPVSPLRPPTATRPSGADARPHPDARPRPDDTDESLLQLRSPGDRAEPSHVETTAVGVGDTRAPDETLSEEAVRRHLSDVESSFLPALSPVLVRPGPPAAAAAAAARPVGRAADARDEPGLTLASPSRSNSVADDKMHAGSTPGYSLRLGKRSKYLRSSRHGSERSLSSFVANSESLHDGDAAVGLGLDYALHSGGALPALGLPRVPSNVLPRSVSIDSMASGFVPDDYDAHARPLEPLAEAASRPQMRDGDAMQTPRPAAGHLDAAPTDTVIAQHVRNVRVPESLAKEYKFKNGLQTPRHPPHPPAGPTPAGRGGRNLTLKEQSSTIERLSKENFDLKLKVMFLSDRLDKLSEEGIKEMISENVHLKTSLAVLQRDNKILRKRVKELERRTKDGQGRPGTARSAASSPDHSDDGDAQEREEELVFLRERVEEYSVEIERLRNEGVHRESERRKLADIVKKFGQRTGDDLGRQDEADVWKDLFEQETARREQADEDNRKLRDELFRLKKEASTGQGAMHHTTNIYNITKKPRDRNASPPRPASGMSGDVEGSNAHFSAATTLVEELRRESEQLRHENAELRREVGAQTSMLTSRNREKERLYQEIEDLKMAQRRRGGGGGGGAALSAVDSLLERSASRAGHDRPPSRGSAKKGQTALADDAEREELENKHAELRDKLSEVRLQNQELQRELEACMEDFETAVQGKRLAEETAISLQEDLDGAMNDLVALQAERDEALGEQGDMEAEFEALRHEAQQEIDTLEAEADQRNEEIQRLQADLRGRGENFDALQEEMRKLSDALVRLEDEQDGKLRRIQQFEEELDATNKELEEVEHKLIEANDKTQRLTVQQESSQGEIAFLREEQEGDKMRIGDLEAALAQAEQGLREERDTARELDGRLQQERVQRELVANKEKEEVQQLVNVLNREASAAKDEARRLRKSLSSREVEATEWKERLIELENNLREALGDLNGTRSSLLKSIAKLQRELENTIRELDTTRASVVEKDRIIKQRDGLLESHALESRKVAELLDKERMAHRNTKSQFETFQKTHYHLSQTASTQDVRIAELESTRGQERRRMATLEQSARDQLAERNELLLTLWQRLSALCGREWTKGNALVDRQAVPSVEVIATRLPGFSKNLLAAIRAIEAMVGSLQSKIGSVERDLHREYQALESNLEVRSKKLERLEAMVRNSASGGSQERLRRLEEAYRQLKVEHTTLQTAHDVRSRVARSHAADYERASGSPSPAIPRGPGDRDRSRSARPGAERSSRSAGSMDVALAGEAGASSNDNRWLLRLRDMEYKLKLEREGRNQDRQAARQRLGGLEMENRDLRDRVRRANSEAE